MNLSRDIHNRILEIIQDVMSELPRMLEEQELEELVTHILTFVMDDLKAFTQKDPAAKGLPDLIFDTYSSFKAVMFYRIANTFYYSRSVFNRYRQYTEYLERIGKKISEIAKVDTGIEIHPAASIGEQFVIDHGIGTVIGETCKIGNNCYILQGVILGSLRITGNKTGKRHPNIGNNVEIGAHVRILGAVEIGDNVIISPYCIIKQNVPSNSIVKINNQYQIQGIKTSIKIYGIVPVDQDSICIYGEGFNNLNVKLLDKDQNSIKGIEALIVEQTYYYIKFQIKTQSSWRAQKDKLDKRSIEKYNIGLVKGGLLEVSIINSSALDTIFANHNRQYLDISM